jgi:hypothetical protein
MGFYLAGCCSRREETEDPGDGNGCQEASQAAGLYFTHCTHQTAGPSNLG